MGNAFADASHQMYDLGGGNFGGINPSQGDWQLPASNYIAAKMPMVVTFPRNAEASTDSYAKNAYTGVEWKVPIIIQGGAWPFKYEITAADGATGLTIGGELDRSIDGATGLTVHTAGSEYGVLTYPNPTGGPHNLNVRVTDQGGATIDVPITLTVGTSKWLFVDPSAPDQTGDGTIGDPFQVIEQIHSNSNLTTTYSGYKVYLRGGTTLLDGMATNNNNYRAEGTNNPVQFIGYPGESAVLEAYEGWFSLSTAHDFYMANLTYQYGAGFSPGGGTVPIYMANALSGCNRIVFYNTQFKDFKGDPANTGSGNSAILYIAGGGSNYSGMSHCSTAGQTGTVIDWYNTTYSVVEHLDVSNVTTGTDDGSSRAMFFLKDSPDHISIRNSDVWDSITWTETNNYGGMGVYGQAGSSNVEVCFNTVDCPLDAATGRRGAFYNWGANPVSDLIENIYVYRNSMKIGFDWEGSAHTNMANGTEVHENNVLDTGTMPTDAFITSTDNIDQATYFDASMELTGASRTTYLGTHGAEVAA